jgi:hypothetical protein
MKTTKDICEIVNQYCYDNDDAGLCDRVWSVCCTMYTIAEKMILEGLY